MNSRILNKDFQHPADGWYQIEALGNHPNRAAGVLQVIDTQSAESIVNHFNADAAAGRLRHGNEMLIDHEHFSDQPDQETRAYGWLQELQNRTDGIYGRIRWTATGKTAVDGGDYRFFSTEYEPGDLQVLNGGAPRRVRPLKLAGLTLTNMNNNRGQKPITNRAPLAPLSSLKSLPSLPPMKNKSSCSHLNPDGTFKGGFNGCVLHMQTCEGHSEESAKKICGKIAQQKLGNRTLKLKVRNLPDDRKCPDCGTALAGDDDDGRGVMVCPDCGQHFAGSGETAEAQPTTKNRNMNKVANALGLADEASEDSILAALTTLQNRLTELEPIGQENQKLKNRIGQFDAELIDALLAERGLKDEKVLNRLKPILAKLENREERIAFLDDCGFKAEPPAKPAARVLNRGTGAAREVAAGDDKTRVDKIKNRCAELQGKGVKYETAWNQALRENTATN